MKPNILLRMLPAALFATSMMIEAFGDARGYNCAIFCVSVVVDPSTFRNETGLWIYYTGFTLANLSFLWCAGRFTLKRYLTVAELAVSTAASFLVISWFFVNLNSLEQLRGGYYVWLVAFLSLVAFDSLTREKEKNAPNKAMETTPVNVTSRADARLAPFTSVSHL